jgi:hypothetical protein
MGLNRPHEEALLEARGLESKRNTWFRRVRYITLVFIIHIFLSLEIQWSTDRLHVMHKCMYISTFDSCTYVSRLIESFLSLIFAKSKSLENLARSISMLIT